MFVDTSCIEILSRKPLWYIDKDGSIGYITNTYSDAEIVRINMNTHITTYPITQYMVVIPELNTVLFDSEENAIIGKSMTMEVENQDLLLQNSISINKHNGKHYVCNGTVPDGLYSIKEYDDQIEGSEMNVMQVRYLNNEEKIKLIHQSNEVNGLTEILVDYIKYNGIKINHHDMKSERLIFDIISESEKVWIESFWVVDNGVALTSSPFMVSPLTGYYMFTSKENAAYFRNDVREGVTTAFTTMVSNGQMEAYYGQLRSNRKAERNQHLQDFATNAWNAVSQFISIDQLLVFATEKGVPGLKKAFHKATKKYRDRQRKQAWLKTRDMPQKNKIPIYS